MSSMKSLDCPARVYTSDRYYIMDRLDSVFRIDKGRGL